MVMHLGEPLLLDVLKRRGARYRETNEENISLGI